MKTIISALIDAWNSHDAERGAALYSEDYQGQDVAEPRAQTGRDGIRQSVSQYVHAFPDIQLRAEKIIEQDDQIALVWSAQGTHLGALLNIPATGRCIAMRGVSVLRVEENQISQALYIWDVAGVLRDMALLPEL